jgi:putative nucleotidyltransferase with HDIG domain
MKPRPGPTLIRLEIVALLAAVAATAALAGEANWNLPLLGTLLAVAVVGDLTAVATANDRVKLSSSFLAIVVAIVFGGVAPGVIVALASILVGWLRTRYALHFLLINLTAYAWFPLLSGLAFHAAINGSGVSQTDPAFYLFVFGLFTLALALDFAIIAGYVSYLERSRFTNQIRRALMPLLPSELASAVLALGIAFAYVEVGVKAVALFGLVLVIFQYLIGALLLSQQRSDELELRARQLAGFQVGVLSALLRTLDLRDRMTARHSAAVARYAREVAAEAGLSEEEQELAHTAGLLHDIGKFILPDHILKGRTKLTEDDWEQIRKHPEEGARIVSQIDGYQPVGEIIHSHHERIDGLGYPRGLVGDDVPEIARIIAVADTYDVMTARDSYREPVSTADAVAELRSVAGAQLDPRFVEIFIDVIARKGLGYRHGEDADFEKELALERRVRAYASGPTSPEKQLHSQPLGRRAA